MLKALITGINGFTGRYMAAELMRAGYDVVGLVHKPMAEPIAGVSAVYVCDLNDASAVTRVVNEIQPQLVAHLAAIAFVAHGDVDAIYRTNVVGARNLLEALSCLAQVPKAVLVASSANVYGNTVDGQLDELTPPAPANDYAVSKLAMEYVAKLYNDRLPITLVRPFNYTGVGQSESFLLPKIVSHVRRGAKVIELGNISVARDFSDVRMVVQYYRRLLESPSAVGEVFNICSGDAHTLEEVLDLVRTISKHDFEVNVNPAFVRANEVKLLIGDPAKVHAQVGTVDAISLTDTLRWMLEATV